MVPFYAATAVPYRSAVDTGAGKSTLMQMIYGNYLANTGRILVGGLDVARAEPREILQLRRETLGYVSQFLRVVPRVPTLEVVAEPLLSLGVGRAVATEKGARPADPAAHPAIALVPVTDHLFRRRTAAGPTSRAASFPTTRRSLLDEPTASLDAANRETVLELIEEAKARGAAIVGIFHDQAARERVADREIDISAFAPDEAA